MSSDRSRLPGIIRNLRGITDSLRSQYEALKRVAEDTCSTYATGNFCEDDYSSYYTDCDTSEMNQSVWQRDFYNSTLGPGGRAVNHNATLSHVGSPIPTQGRRNAPSPLDSGKTGLRGTPNAPNSCRPAWSQGDPGKRQQDSRFLEYMGREGYPNESETPDSWKWGTADIKNYFNSNPSVFEPSTNPSFPVASRRRFDNGPKTSTPNRVSCLSSSSDGEDILEALLLWWSHFIMANLNSNDCSFMTSDSEFLTTLEEIVIAWRQRSQITNRSFM